MIIYFFLCSVVKDESGARSRYGLRREMLRVLACRMVMFGTSKVVLVITLFSLISCTQGLSTFGLRNLKEGKNLQVSVMKFLFNLLRFIHMVLPSSRQPN